MNISEIINKKNNRETLSYDEINYVVDNYTNGFINDNDMTLFLKSVCEFGMNESETIDLTKCMLKTGSMLDLSMVSGVKVDKHSTGGVGDKTTLIVGSIVASCGVNVAKMSGRALGFTGGTIDKLESIPGFKVNLEKEEFIKQLNDIHFAITSQTEDLVKADKKIYALRDVTNTVSSIPLIASSIMSKKIATSADVIVLDVKVGNGALVKTLDEAEELSNLMIKIGSSFNRKVVAVLSNMSEPLGYNIGNSLEIKEVIETLSLRGEENLLYLSKVLSTYMIKNALNISYNDSMKKVEEVLINGNALKKFYEVVQYQKGEIKELPNAKYKYIIKSSNEGFISEIDTEKLGIYSMNLGAGRKNKTDVIDYSCGLIIKKKKGDYINKGDALLEIHSNKILLDINALNGFIKYSDEKVSKEDIIIKIIE